jgi:hypothetical protein
VISAFLRLSLPVSVRRRRSRGYHRSHGSAYTEQCRSRYPCNGSASTTGTLPQCSTTGCTSPQLIVDAGPAHATHTVPMSTPREPVMSASREPHPLPPNDAPRAFTTVRMPSALCISLTPMPASLARTKPATYRISSPTQPSLRSSSQTASTVHVASCGIFDSERTQWYGSS